MLEYTRAAVTRNQSEKKINSLLDHVAASTDMRLLQVMRCRRATLSVMGSCTSIARARRRPAACWTS